MVLIVTSLYRFVYCGIGKVASSTWIGVLKRAIGDKSAGRQSPRLRHPINLRSTSMKKFFKFLFVRHPFDRILSAYKSKFRAKSQYWKTVRIFYGSAFKKYIYWSHQLQWVINPCQPTCNLMMINCVTVVSLTTQPSYQVLASCVDIGI